MVSEPVTMVDNLRAEGGDNAETERTLAERLHKLTTLENKEVMSDSKIDQLANLVKVLRKKEIDSALMGWATHVPKYHKYRRDWMLIGRAHV